MVDAKRLRAAALLVLVATTTIFLVVAGASQETQDEAASVGRSLLATCDRDASGRLVCVSELTGGGSNPPPRNNQPPFNPEPIGRNPIPGPRLPTNPGFPNPNPNPNPRFPGGGVQVDFRGCMANRPAGGQDPQTAARQLFNQLINSPGCGFLPPNFLRTAFHDSGTFSINKRREGANGSIRLELAEPANAGGRGQIPRTVDIIGDVQAQLQVVGISLSFADLVQLAAAEAVAVAGGPVYSVPLGRIDSNSRDVYNTFPDTQDNINTLLQKFGSMGLSVGDFVALSGAHTIGLQTTSTPNRFDNGHYQLILRRSAPLASDNALMDNPATASWVRAYANNQGEFFNAFQSAMLKVANMGADFGSNFQG